MKKGFSVLTVILWIAVAIWMVGIFMFSAENAEESLETSDGIVDVVVEKVTEDVKNEMTSEEYDSLRMKISTVVRKCAHFSVYLVLGVLVTLALGRHISKGAKLVMFSQLWCSLYAVSDEVHQIFVPGRAGRILDVMIDSAGALCGIAVVMAVASIFFAKKN